MTGLIIANHSNLYEVKEIEHYMCQVRGKIKRQGLSPLVGDRVEFSVTDKEKKEGVIEGVLPRINCSKRPKMSNLEQLVLVVSSKLPKPDLLTLDKQLIYAQYLKIPAVIVVNKIDLDEEASLRKIKEIYEKIGYPVLGTVAKEKKGILELIERLRGKINAFSGNSGVGKSTLMNAIFETELTKEGKISKKNKRGKNTTTSVSLYELEKNTYVADTPGFSTFAIDEIESKDLASYFVEFLPHITECEYDDCHHIKEEKCGVKKALQEGKISQERYEHYTKIYIEKKEKEEHRW